ncbi:hypothetical protein [Rhizobium sp. A37_96]
MDSAPFSRVMVGLGLRSHTRRISALVTTSFGVPLLLLLFAADIRHVTSFLTDWGVISKFLVGTMLLAIADRPITRSQSSCAEILILVPIVASVSARDATAAIDRAEAKASALLPELACVALAATASVANARHVLAGNDPAWAAGETGAVIVAIWCIAVSNTLFWFLFTRVIWKHLIWTELMFALARCPLRLVASHPDGRGGLGFVGAYPSGYWPFILSAGCVTASAVGHALQHQSVTPATFTIVCGVWLAFVAGFFGAPTASLAVQVHHFKSDMLRRCLEPLVLSLQAAERNVLDGDAASDIDEEGKASAEEVSALYKAALKLSPVLFDRHDLLSVFVPALLPMLLVGGSFLSFAQLGPIAKRLLFF